MPTGTQLHDLQMRLFQIKTAAPLSALARFGLRNGATLGSAAIGAGVGAAASDKGNEASGALTGALMGAGIGGAFRQGINRAVLGKTKPVKPTTNATPTTPTATNATPITQSTTAATTPKQPGQSFTSRYGPALGTAAVGGAGGYMMADDDHKGTGAFMGALGGGIAGAGNAKRMRGFFSNKPAKAVSNTAPNVTQKTASYYTQDMHSSGITPEEASEMNRAIIDGLQYSDGVNRSIAPYVYTGIGGSIGGAGGVVATQLLRNNATSRARILGGIAGAALGSGIGYGIGNYRGAY